MGDFASGKSSAARVSWLFYRRWWVWDIYHGTPSFAVIYAIMPRRFIYSWGLPNQWDSEPFLFTILGSFKKPNKGYGMDHTWMLKNPFQKNTASQLFRVFSNHITVWNSCAPNYHISLNDWWVHPLKTIWRVPAILVGVSIINHSCWGTSIPGNPYMHGYLLSKRLYLITCSAHRIFVLWVPSNVGHNLLGCNAILYL